MNGSQELTGEFRGLEPEDLNGHTLEELTDYLERGRTPAVPSIDESPSCRLALDALERLHTLSGDLLTADTEAEGQADETWVQSLITNLALETQAGRRLPLAGSENGSDLGITEGGLRALVRAAEREVPGVILGRIRFEGEVSETGAPVDVNVEISAQHGMSLPRLVEHLRQSLHDRLTAHTALNLAHINITVREIHFAPRGRDHNG